MRGDLNVPLDHNTQNLLLKQASNLADLPKLSGEGQLSKSERVREWKLRVDQRLAALHPLFREYWSWSWAAGDSFYQIWLQLNHDARGTLCTSWSIPPRYEWVEAFLIEKVVACLPKRFVDNHAEILREGRRATVHGLLCQVFQVYQPGGLSEKDELERRIKNPNVCSNAAAALHELRS